MDAARQRPLRGDVRARPARPLAVPGGRLARPPRHVAPRHGAQAGRRRRRHRRPADRHRASSTARSTRAKGDDAAALRDLRAAARRRRRPPARAAAVRGRAAPPRRPHPRPRRRRAGARRRPRPRGAVLAHRRPRARRRAGQAARRRGRPGAGPLQRVVRVLPPLDARPGDRPRHAGRRRRPPRLRRRDGLRRRSTCRRSTRSARPSARAATTRSTPTPDDTGSPWAIGGAGRRAHRGAPRARHGRRRRQARRRAAASAASSWRSTSRSSARPTTRGSPSTRRGSPTGPTARSSTPRTRRRSTRTSTRSTSRATTGRACGTALADVIRFWIDAGVTMFRVDNPHTKAFAFWEWVIATIRSEHPEAIFLAEAFTRPAGDGAAGQDRLQPVVHVLHVAPVVRGSCAQYFERAGHAHGRLLPAQRLAEHARHPHRAAADRRPGDVRHPGRPRRHAVAVVGHLRPGVRAVEHLPVRPGSEEYLDSEKYQLRQWDLDQPDSLAPLLARLNRDPPRAAGARPPAHAALPPHRQRRRCSATRRPTRPGVGPPILVVVNLDADHRQQGCVDVDLAARPAVRVRRTTSSTSSPAPRYRWHGARNFVELDPSFARPHLPRASPL